MTNKINTMKKKLFNKGIAELKKLKLTSDEKASCLNAIFTHVESGKMSSSPLRHASPYTFGGNAFSWISSNRWSTVVSLVVIIALIGGGIANAAQKALPGEPLYAIKTELIEPVSVALASTPKAKAEIQIKIATTRLIEAERLAKQNKLDEKIVEQLSNSLDTNSKAVASALDRLKQSDSALIVSSLQHTSSDLTVNTTADNRGKTTDDNDIANDLETDYQASMSAHSKILASISRESNTSLSDRGNAMKLVELAHSKSHGDIVPTRDASDILVAKVASPAVDKTATTVRSISSDKNDSNLEKQDLKKSYEKDKKRVQEIVEKTLTNIQSTAINTNVLDEDTINSVNETVDQARVEIEKADRAIRDGDTAEAHASLKESEKSIKEASILFDNGVQKAKEEGKNKNSDRNKNNNNEKNSGKDSRQKETESGENRD